MLVTSERRGGGGIREKGMRVFTCVVNVLFKLGRRCVSFVVLF